MVMVLNDEQLMLQDSAAEYFSAELNVDTFRQIRKTKGVVTVDPDAWQSMVEFGWSAILVPEELDGLGFGITGLAAICIEAGRCLAATHLIQTSGLGVRSLLACRQSDQRDQLIRGVVRGEVIICTVGAAQTRFVSEGSTANHLLVFNDATLDIYFIGQTERAAPLGLIDRRDYVDFDLSEMQPSFSLVLKDKDAEDSVESLAALLTAAELFGICSETFDRTLAYLNQREQFGQKIGSFQALQHRMAKAFMELQMFKSVFFDALDAAEEQRQDMPLAISHAKLLANDVSQLICNEAIQMHGGMGITDELDIGLFYKRARVLRTAYGSSAWHKQRCADLSGF